MKNTIISVLNGQRNAYGLMCFRLQLEAQNHALRELLESARNSTKQTVDQLTSDVTEKQTLIEALQAQVVVYREDFENERQDRQRAQSRLVELDAELEELKKNTVSREQTCLY